MVWLVVYILQSIIVAVCLGCFFAGCKRFFMVGTFSRFFMGIASTPFFMGTVVYILGLFWPGGPKSLFLCAPVALAVCLLFAGGSERLIVPYLKKNAAKALQSLKHISVWVTLSAIVLICVLVGIKSVDHARADFFAHDSLHYLMQAKYFANDRLSLEIDNYSGEKAGTVQVDSHGPTWPTYLGHALMFTDGAPGYPNDFPARAAFQITLVYMLAGLVALALAVKYDFRMVALSFALMFTVKSFFVISHSSSRHGFRITGLFLFAVLVISIFNKMRNQQSLTASALWWPATAAVAYFTISGHGLNSVMIALLSFTIGVFMLIYHRKPADFFITFSAIGVGALLGFIKNIILFVEYGYLRPSSAFNTAGTPLYDVAVRYGAERSNNFSIYLNNWFLLIFGALSAAIILFCAVKKRQLTMPAFFAAITVMLATPILGVYDFTGYQLAEWFLKNYTYSLYIYPFLSICTAWVILILSHKAPAKISQAIYIAVCLSLVLCSSRVISKWSHNRYDEGPQNWIADELIIHENLTDGKIIISDFPHHNYYLQQPAVLIPTPETRELIHAETAGEAGELLKRMNTGVVVFYRAEGIGLQETACYEYLANNAKKINDSPEIFVLA